MFNKFPKLKGRRFWGSGLLSRGTYYASVGHISEESIRKYIESQKGQG
ncbi:MAG: transposase [Dehalococcoidia bacterium]